MTLMEIEVGRNYFNTSLGANVKVVGKFVGVETVEVATLRLDGEIKERKWLSPAKLAPEQTIPAPRTKHGRDRALLIHAGTLASAIERGCTLAWRGPGFRYEVDSERYLAATGEELTSHCYHDDNYLWSGWEIRLDSKTIKGDGITALAWELIEAYGFKAGHNEPWKG